METLDFSEFKKYHDCGIDHQRQHFYISSDQLNLYLDFDPTNIQEKFTIDNFILNLKHFLEEKKIFLPLNELTLSKAISQGITKKEQVKKILLVKGKAPIDEESRKIEFSSSISRKINKKHQPYIKKDGSTDFKKIQSIILIIEGSLIGTIIPPIRGELGYTIYQKEIPYKRKKSRDITIGNNIYLEKNALYALKSGSLWIKNNSVEIKDSITISNVDYNTGNLYFLGNVTLTGEIEHEFRIDITGDLILKKTVNVSDIKVGGSIKSEKGLIGDKSNHIYVQGQFEALFIDNINISSLDKIIIKKEINNCSIKSRDKLYTYLNSSIINSKIYMEQGIFCFNVGSSRSEPTELYCGVDFKIKDEIKKLTALNRKITKKINKYSHHRDLLLKHNKIEAYEKLEELIRKLSLGQNRLIGQLTKEIKKLDKDLDAKIIVMGTIYPGTYIEICSVPYKVIKKLSKVVFFLDKKRGVISYKPITSNKITF